MPIITGACLINLESVLGRWFIIQNILNNISSVPLSGFGWNSFNLYYSEWQSSYFKNNHSEIIYTKLADCPLFAFNEMLNFYIEIGISAIGIFLFFWAFILRILMLRVSEKTRHFAISCLTILIFSLISYPFHSTWIIVLFTILNLLITTSLIKLRFKVLITNLIIACIITLTGINYIQYLDIKSNWTEAQMIPYSELEAKKEALKGLITNLYNNPYFLNDYIKFLLDVGEINKAQKILVRYEKYFIRYDYLMSLAQSFFMQKDLEKARYFYNSAHYLIPNRFIPLVFLMRIAVQQKDNLMARKYAIRILTMNEKIPSNITRVIKDEAQKWINLNL